MSALSAYSLASKMQSGWILNLWFFWWPQQVIWRGVMCRIPVERGRRWLTGARQRVAQGRARAFDSTTRVA